MKLYQIDDRIEHLLAIGVDPETGEVRPEVSAELDALEMQLTDKALQVAAFLVGERLEAEAVALQAKRLQERARVHERKAEWLERYLAEHVPAGTKLKDDRVTIGWRKSTAVVIDDESGLSDDFLRVRIEPDKRAIAEALKAGAHVKGARLETRENLVVK